MSIHNKIEAGVYFSEYQNRQLARQIVDYWAERGFTVNVEVIPLSGNGGPNSPYCLRSDIGQVVYGRAFEKRAH